MAEFCKQCAEELGFRADFTNFFMRDNITPDGESGYPVLCETCGPAIIIDDKGTCGSFICDGSERRPGPHGAA